MQLHIRRLLRDIRPRSENGFTLVEVLAALGLTVIFLAVLSQMLHTGVKIWNKADRSYFRQQQQSFIYQILEHDISGLVCRTFLPETAVEGDEKHLVFWRENQTGLIKVEYRYDPIEKKVYRSTAFWGGPPRETKLFDAVDQWRFEYYQASTGNWVYDWKTDRRQELPALVRVSVKTAAFDLGGLVVPVKVWHTEVQNEAGTGW